MTVTISEAAGKVDTRRSRSTQTHAGASDIGPCMRRAAYIFLGRPATDPEKGSKMAAILGTWIHLGALDALHQVTGCVTEIATTAYPLGRLAGHVDAIEVAKSHVKGIRASARPAGHDICSVDDVKTKADDRMLDRVRLFGPPEDHTRQVYTYAWLLQAFGPTVDTESTTRLAVQRALAEKGPMHVDQVRLRYIARDRGEEHTWEEAANPARIEEAAERFAWVVGSSEPESLPREQDGPGLSYTCDSCPFKTACWGSAAVTEADVWPQAVRIVEGSTTVEEALAEYLEGKVQASDGDVKKKRARAALTGTDPATYGDVARLSWSGGRPKGPVPDVDEMAAVLQRAGVDIPQKDGGKTSRTINVSPV